MSAKNDFSKKISGFVFKLTEETGMTKSQIAAKVKEKYKDEFQTYGFILADMGLLRLILDMLKQVPKDEGPYQLEIAGTGTPERFCYADADGQIFWIATMKATKSMMVSRNDMLKSHIKGSIQKQQEWEEKLDYLEPAFMASPDCTVEEAMLFMGRKAA